MCEQILENLATARNFRVALLRYFNAWGADPDGQLSERLAIDAASGRGPPLQIFGADYPTADRTCGHDFVRVSDLARGSRRCP
jgi:UDP-arabinose 4-epimerase